MSRTEWQIAWVCIFGSIAGYVVGSVLGWAMDERRRKAGLVARRATRSAEREARYAQEAQTLLDLPKIEDDKEVWDFHSSADGTSPVKEDPEPEPETERPRGKRKPNLPVLRSRMRRTDEITLEQAMLAGPRRAVDSEPIAPPIAGNPMPMARTSLSTKKSDILAIPTGNTPFEVSVRVLDRPWEPDEDSVRALITETGSFDMLPELLVREGQTDAELKLELLFHQDPLGCWSLPPDDRMEDSPLFWGLADEWMMREEATTWQQRPELSK